MTVIHVSFLRGFLRWGKGAKGRRLTFTRGDFEFAVLESARFLTACVSKQTGIVTASTAFRAL